MIPEVKKIWYNPAASAFEGRVDISRGGTTFRYPCTVEGPLTLKRSEVLERMKYQALKMSDTPPEVFASLNT